MSWDGRSVQIKIIIHLTFIKKLTFPDPVKKHQVPEFFGYLGNHRTFPYTIDDGRLLWVIDSQGSREKTLSPQGSRSWWPSQAIGWVPPSNSENLLSQKGTLLGYGSQAHFFCARPSKCCQILHLHTFLTKTHKVPKKIAGRKSILVCNPQMKKSKFPEKKYWCNWI